MSNLILTAKGLSKVFDDGARQIELFHNLDLDLKAGEMVAVIGRSGVGKSTLLHMLGGLEKPTMGDISIANKSLVELSLNEVGNLRNKHLGFVYQFHHLLSEFNAWENVAMPLLIANKSCKLAKKRAYELLDMVGLKERREHQVTKLSGGERQRVAIARALANDPDCVLADEPTGNLDQETALRILDLIKNINSRFGTSFLIVTHDPALAAKCHRVINLDACTKN
ncbi:MAG: ATP-binding cassette domain-containing protein [Gammaproteobacteria bacterium]|nr:ATP-binding cassette domain-containing protein [Gammaproteobacteria bacterium]